MIVKKHWLFGDCKFNVEVREEDNCSECVHAKVCKLDMENFCLNYCFGTSKHRGCGGCLHRFTRLVRTDSGFPCFKCKHFMEIKK